MALAHTEKQTHMSRWAAIALVVLASTSAGANGRVPQTTGIRTRPGDPHTLYVSATFGLMISHDDGCTFQWACESDIGYAGIYDPLYGVAQDGSIFATTVSGLRVSRDGGCSFQTVGDAVRVTALDVAVDGTVWMATGDAQAANHISSSADNGATFTSRAPFDTTVRWTGIAVAPTDARRIYATGSQPGTGDTDGGQPKPTPMFVRSDDGGATWTTLPLTGVAFGGLPSVRVVAVDPQNPDIVYVASELGANPPNGDRVYRASDAGVTLVEVVATVDPVASVTFLTPQQVFVAGPNGSFRSMDNGVSFAALTGAPHLSCLSTLPDGTLMGCAMNWAPDFMALTVSRDGGASWESMWRFAQLAGPLECSPGTAENDECAPLWPALRQQFGATGPTCGEHVWPGDPTPKPTPRGCCDSGRSSGPPIVVPAFVILAMYRRRRRVIRRDAN